jgi:thermitase
MRRPARRPRFAHGFVCEPLESRTLLDGDPLGMWPLRDPSPDTSVLVGFVNGTSPATIQAALAPLRGRILSSYPNGPSDVALGEGVSPSVAIAALAGKPFVRYAQPDAIIHVDSFIPNDPQFSSQWGLSNPNGVDIGAPAAWSVTTGSPGVVVAVVDSGVDTSNPDLATQLWTDPKTGLHGWNFINNNGNIQDQDGHGTHVAGIIAAATNNGYGVAGVAFSSKIMALKFIAANGNGDTNEAVQAIYFAVSHGARIINASWGGPQYSQPLQDAIAYAYVHNVIFVTAAGNESANNDVVPSYPARDRLPNTLGVAAIDNSGNLASFSNYGALTVDLGAPGVDIRSTVPGGLATYSGTSMSAPYVSGTAALVLSVHPNWSAAQVVHQILVTVKPLPSLLGRTVSGGMVDAAAAVGAAPSQSRSLGGPTPTATTEDDVHAEIYAAPAYFAIHGGSIAGFLEALYTDVLGRDVDAGGFAYWNSVLNAGMSPTQVVRSVLNSTEAITTKVAQAFVQDFGLNRAEVSVFKQAPGVIQLASQIAAGQLTLDQLQAMILSSDGFYSTHGGTPLSFVNALYQVLLDRQVDTNGAVSWVGQILSGEPRIAVVQGILGSAEAKRTEAAQWFATDLNLATPIAALKVDPNVIAWSSQIGG